METDNNGHFITLSVYIALLFIQTQGLYAIIIPAVLMGKLRGKGVGQRFTASRQ